jgi:glycosyltransferase involved in cell wall biosynthesis
VTIVIFSKSTWLPTARREHAIATSAARAGHRVVFIEAPVDVRALAGSQSRRAWVAGLRQLMHEPAPSVRVLRQATVVPGHFSDLAQAIDARRLRRGLRTALGHGHEVESGGARPVVVATAPWQWPAVSATPASRRVFDCADDWRALIPRRRAAIDALYRQIARDADAVVLTSAQLVDAFPGAAVSIVPNGAGEELLEPPLGPPESELRMVYAGTLSERLDATLLAAVLERLPDWSVELYGECRYARRGGTPAPELEKLLREHRGRASWHGPIDRARLAEALDRGRILIAPYRPGLSLGQDSMKLYDYAARGRPIVCTPGALGERSQVDAAGVIEAATAAEFATAVAGAEPEASEARRSWAMDNRWESRWPRWAQAALDARAVGAVS